MVFCIAGMQYVRTFGDGGLDSLRAVIVAMEGYGHFLPAAAGEVPGVTNQLGAFRRAPKDSVERAIAVLRWGMTSGAWHDRHPEVACRCGRCKLLLGAFGVKVRGCFKCKA